ncbi:dienelactone hydrolase family protein [Sphingomonas sp. LY160]|uniref:dienelactone hydrolase family protein n=1 Tax=Sphingomonas sp. LY160 TaxID=3095342 RepID=UPI002ADEE776|nr:dienelactone hydrolase family protein [Sphingomonas sp. LY160]MEA1072121.1 dienelactone hydrolase family protein [Sphingomonas sp. LY160]
MREIAQARASKAVRHEWYPVADARSTILLFPTVRGISELEQRFATELNAKARSVLLADLYGDRFTPERRDEAFKAMEAIKSDRAAMRELLQSVLATLREVDGVDETPVVAIGFCFGGQCALDLARSGADIAGVASFHGLLDPPGLPPQPIRAKIIAFHGWDDPLAKPESVVTLGEELTVAGCDWQVHGFGGVGHGFTNPAATGQMPGIEYDAAAARRSWAMFDLFLAEIES